MHVKRLNKSLKRQCNKQKRLRVNNWQRLVNKLNVKKNELVKTFDVLAAVEEQLPGFPIVLHGSSSVPQEYVDIINKFGGKSYFLLANYLMIS